jgi:hypothetical protein
MTVLTKAYYPSVSQFNLVHTFIHRCTILHFNATRIPAQNNINRNFKAVIVILHSTTERNRILSDRVGQITDFFASTVILLCRS